MTKRFINFFFFGDSISFGQFIPPHKTWVNKLSSDISEKFSDADLRVMNVSISGNTTRMALERMPFDVQAHSVDYIVIEFGLNDCNCWADHKGMPRVSEKAFAANLEEIITRARTFGAKKVFICTNHPTPKTENFPNLSFSYQQQNTAYNHIIRNVANENKVILIDIEKYWLENEKIAHNLNAYLLDDGIHLSEIGHQEYYNVAYPVIIKNL